MDANARQQTVDLEQRLLDRGERFSFFQALRLLRLLSREQGTDPSDTVRVRPKLALGFPQTDLDQIERHDRGEYHVTANFLGLYGVDSPLPTFYTEDLLVEQSDGHSVNREFLDIFAQSLYPLLFKAWLKTRPALRVLEYQDARMLQILYGFVGVETDAGQLGRPGVGSLLFCGALYSQQTRSASGLRTLLAACFPQARVEVRELQLAWNPIPVSQQFSLGSSQCVLGVDAHIGHRCRSLDAITLGLSELPTDLFRLLAPGGSEHARFCFLVDYYLVEPLPVRVELTLRKDHASTAKVGAKRWSELGRDTWLLPLTPAADPSMAFDLPLRKNRH